MKIPKKYETERQNSVTGFIKLLLFTAKQIIKFKAQKK
jgi:hypothetical protein